MAIIGFLVLFGLGLLFSFGALAVLRVSVGFSGKVEWPSVIALGGIGAGLLYAAVTHCPFTITIN